MPRTSVIRFWKQRTSLWLLACLSLILLTLAIAITATFVIQSQARQRSDHEVEVMLALSQVQQTIVDAETGQRGYLLTRSAKYLAPYWNAKRRLADVSASLDRLEVQSEQSFSHEQATRLKALIDRKMAELETTVAMARGGNFAEAFQIVRTDIGRNRMEQIRRNITELRQQAQARKDAALQRFEIWRLIAAPLFGLMLLGIILFIVYGFHLQYKRAALEVEAAQMPLLREAHHRVDLLNRELNHRVKNLFSVVLAIISLSARQRPEQRALIEDVRARINALALAHSVTQGEEGMRPVSLHELIVQTLSPYGVNDGQRITVDAGHAVLPLHQITPIGLILHELATNAVKYGALSDDKGTLSVRCEEESRDGGRYLNLHWREENGSQLPLNETNSTSKGFGTTMIDLCVKQLKGNIIRERPETGVAIIITWLLEME